MLCDRCGDATHEIALSVAAGQTLCLRCYERLPNDSVEIGQQLGILPCPRCGEPLGARYGPEGLCWPCTGLKPVAPARPKPDAYQRLVYRVWDRLEQEGNVFLLERGLIAGWCPVCHAGTISVRFIHVDPPTVRIRSCDLGCSADMIRAAL